MPNSWIPCSRAAGGGGAAACRADRAELRSPARSRTTRKRRRAADHGASHEGGIGCAGDLHFPARLRRSHASRSERTSPVSRASLTKKSLASTSLPSAGTRSPAASRTRSPGTRASALTVTSRPSRSTRSVRATEARSRSAASSARCSCRLSRTTLSRTITEMMTKLAISPVRAEMRAAPIRIRTRGLRNRDAILRASP